MSGAAIKSSVTVMVFSILLISVISASAGVPEKINYQGKLTDVDTGEPLTGSQAMTFRLFDDPAAGSLLWSESVGVSADSSGIFSVILGQVSPIDISFERPAWLEIEIDSEVLSPRRELVSVPYSFYAAHSDLALDAGMLESLHADAFADTAHSHDARYCERDSLNTAGTLNDASNPVDWTRLKNVPAGFADGSDEVGGGAGDSHSLDAADGDPVDALYVDQYGKVGIGTTAPEAPLHVFKDSNSTVQIVIENPNTGASSAERVSFDNEDGSLAGIAVFDHEHGTYPAQMNIFNNRPDGAMKLIAEGIEVLTLKDGRMGVREEEPAHTLDVDGTASMAGFRMPTDAGTGKVLTSDSQGGGTWQAPPAQPDGDWTVVGNDLIAAVSGNVNIGNVESNQVYPIHIRRDQNDFVFVEIENQHTGSSSAEGIAFRHEGGGTSKIACYDDGNAQYPGQMVLQSGKGSRQIHFLSHLKTCMFADSSGYVSVGRIDPENLMHVEGAGTEEGGVNGYGEVSARLKTIGGHHTALSVDAIADRDAIVYFAEEGEAVWGLRNDVSDGSKFQLRYHGGTGLGMKYLTVDSTGKVGLGTVYPDQKLHIYEESAGALSYGIKLDNPSDMAMTSTGILFKVDGGGAGRGKGAIVYERTDTWNRGDFYILQNNDANPDEVTLADPVMTIRNSGNVGIGTTIPSSRFEVQSSATGGRLCFFKQSSASNAADVIRAETEGSGNALSGSSQDGRGVVGHSANDYAGYFNGDVYVSGSINKAACSFVIDHPLDPENRILRHNCVESPEHLLIYRGKVRLDAEGEGLVEMVDYFDAVARAEEASIHLTAVGRPFQNGAEWNGDFDGFTVYGEPNREVFWEVLAERDDPVVRQVALPTEEEKGPGNKLCDRGRLLNPAAYGYPEALGQDYELLEGLTEEQ